MTSGGFETLFATTGTGIQRAVATGGAWELSKHLTDLDVRCLATSTQGTLLAGTQGDGLYRSNDGGDTWAPSGLDGSIVKSLSFCASEPSRVYAGTKPPHIFRSDDGGASWNECGSFRSVRGRAVWRQPAEKPTTAYVQSLACSPTDPDVVVVGIEAGAVVRTTDGGRTWSNHLKGSCRDCHSLHFHPDGKHVYEGGGGVLKPGFAMSGDRGATWERPADGLDLNYGWAVNADPAEPKRVYVSLSPGAMKAHSDGNARAAIFRREGEGRWARLAGGLPQPLANMPYALLSDPARPGYLLAGLADGELWETTDSGETWTRHPVTFEAIHRTLIGL